MLAKCLLSKMQVKEVKIFYSYAHKDSSYRASLDEVLARFKWDVAVRTWYDGEVRPGTEWAQQVHRHLDAADIILLFITQGFVDSQYCMNQELPRAMDRHEHREARVIPIILEPTTPRWNALPFSKLQVLPPGGLPLCQWQDPARGMRETVHAIVNEITEPALEATDRTRWKLYLGADFKTFSLSDEAETVGVLREVSLDPTLRSCGTAAGGSVVLDMDSTRDGFARVREWFGSGTESTRRLSLFQVLQIIEWYGASIHAATGIDLPPPPEPPDPANLQFPTEPAEGPNLKGLTIDPLDPRHTTALIDSGNLPPDDPAARVTTEEIMEDYLTCFAVPEEEVWVNLCPNDHVKLLGEPLQGTRVGRILLEHDLLLKRVASSLLHPDHEVGARYWRQVFAQAAHLTGHVDHQFNTHPRVWMVPDTAEVWDRVGQSTDPTGPEWLREPLPEGRRQVVFLRGRIKIMSEQDLFAVDSARSEQQPPIERLCHDIFREIVVPVIETEVNHGRAFAAMRRFFRTLVLALWVKTEFGGAPAWKQYFESRNPLKLSVECDRARWYLDNREVSMNRALDEREDRFEAEFAEGVIARESGDLARSRELLERVVANRLRDHGEKHFLTHVAMSQLGRTLRALGEMERAEQLHRRVLDLRRRLLGERHQYTINSTEILADTLLAAGRVPASQFLAADAPALEVTFKREYQDDNRLFYERYLSIYRNGVFYVRRHEFDPSSSSRITRCYFSGAIDFRNLKQVLRTVLRWEA